MATIRFFTRTITKDKNALVPIYVRLKSGRKIDLCCKADILVKPDSWSNETQQARQRAEVFKYNSGETETDQIGRQKFNEKIAGLRSAIESELMQTHQEDITTEWLQKIIDKHWHPDKYKTNLFGYIEMFIERAKTKPNPKTGRPVSYKMQREYIATFNHLKNYSTEKNKVIDFKNIDLNFYDSFTQYLQDKKLAVNTLGKKIQTLKTFLNSAKDENLNSYEGYKSKRFVKLSEESDSIYLNESELTKLYEKDFSNRPGLERVRDLFLVGCWTGCRFSDISQITPDNIKEGFIHLKQYKTGNKVIIPLHPIITAIINKYGGQLPEAISNQKFNEALKDIARLAGIDEPTHKAITKGGVKISTAYKKYELVTTHTARRSFATNLYKSGLPTLSIMAITGHKTEEAFLKYIKVTPDEHAKKLQIHWNNRHLKVV
jgi:integrase